MSTVFIGRVAVAAPPKSPADLVVCPYTVEEIEAAIGLRVRWQPQDPVMKRDNGMHLALCRGIGDGAEGYLSVTQLMAPAATAAKRFDAILRTEYKGAEPIPNDPDAARWVAQPEIRAYTLVYIRGAVMTKISIASPDKQILPRLKDGFLKLKRVP